MRIDSHANKVERIVPRYNPDVNQWWMCDAGRKSMESRTISPMANGRMPGPNDGARLAPAIDGLRVVAGWLKDSGAKEGGKRVGIALSASLSNEDVYAWARLALTLPARIYLLPRAGWAGDELLRSADRDCNAVGTRAILGAVAPGFGDEKQLLADAAGLDTLIVLDNEIAASQALLACVSGIARSAVLTDLAGPLSDAAQVVVPLASLQQREGTIVNLNGWVQRLAAPLKPAVTAVAPHVAAAMLSHHGAGVDLDITERMRPAEIFARIAAQVPAFAHLDYAEIGDLGRALGHGGELAPRRVRINGTTQWEPDPVAPTHRRRFAIRRGA